MVLVGFVTALLKLVTGGWPADADWSVFALLVCTVLLLLVLGLELVDKLRFRDELVMARQLQADGSFVVGVAGHPPALRVGAGGNVLQRFGRGAYPLGVKQTQSYDLESGRLSEGELLLFHSDGLPEARDAGGREFGDGRILATLSRMAGRSAADVAAALSAEVLSFLGRQPVGDDVSIAVLRRLPD